MKTMPNLVKMLGCSVLHEYWLQRDEKLDETDTEEEQLYSILTWDRQGEYWEYSECSIPIEDVNRTIQGGWILRAIEFDNDAATTDLLDNKGGPATVSIGCNLPFDEDDQRDDLDFDFL